MLHLRKNWHVFADRNLLQSSSGAQGTEGSLYFDRSHYAHSRPLLLCATYMLLELLHLVFAVGIYVTLSSDTHYLYGFTTYYWMLSLACESEMSSNGPRPTRVLSVSSCQCYPTLFTKRVTSTGCQYRVTIKLDNLRLFGN